MYLRYTAQVQVRLRLRLPRPTNYFEFLPITSPDNVNDAFVSLHPDAISGRRSAENSFGILDKVEDGTRGELRRLAEVEVRGVIRQ